jgi:L-ascorbate metabolism protein UlaG (beta-lactamase superfamily)
LGEPVGFRWLGVAGFELQAGGRVLAVDPFVTRPPFWQLWFGRVHPDRALLVDTVPRCDHVLVTHAHYDHVMDVPDLARSTGAMVYGSGNTCRLLATCGVPLGQVREIQPGDELDLGPFRVQVLAAEHLPVPGFSPGLLRSNLAPPLRLRDYRMDSCFGFLVEAGGLRMLNWPGVQPGPAPRAHVLLARPGGRKAYYETLFSAVRPRLVIPLHWDDLFRSLSRPLRPFFEPPRLTWPPLRRADLGQLKATVEAIAPGTQVLVPRVLATYDLAALLP